MEDINLNAKIR